MRKKIVFICFVVVAILLFFVLPIWYFFTLPSMEKQLAFSPFHNDGNWKCEDERFLISSSDGYVKMTINDGDKSYSLNLHYLSTRGFNHKYAAIIYISEEGYNTFCSCVYDFKENEFSLFGFDLRSSIESECKEYFNVSTLKFYKVSEVIV